MDTLAIWGRPPRLDSPVRLSDSPSVCLSACVTDAILCHTYEQSTESRWANKFITCLNALTIHSVRTDVCVCVWCWCGCGHGCLLGVCWVYLLPAQGLPHIFILNLSLSSWQPHKYIHTPMHTYTVTQGRALGPLATELSCIIHEMHIIPTTAIMTAIQQCVWRLDRIMHMHNLLYSLFLQCNW